MPRGRSWCVSRSGPCLILQRAAGSRDPRGRAAAGRRPQRGPCAALCTPRRSAPGTRRQQTPCRTRLLDTLLEGEELALLVDVSRPRIVDQPAHVDEAYEAWDMFVEKY